MVDRQTPPPPYLPPPLWSTPALWSGRCMEVEGGGGGGGRGGEGGGDAADTRVGEVWCIFGVFHVIVNYFNPPYLPV